MELKQKDQQETQDKKSPGATKQRTIQVKQNTLQCFSKKKKDSKLTW